MNSFTAIRNNRDASLRSFNVLTNTIPYYLFFWVCILYMNIQRNSFITILSTRKSGKSFMIAEMIYMFLTNDKDNNCDVMYMFSNTARFEEGGNYEFIDKRCIFKADIATVDKVVSRLMELQLKTKKKHHILLVFDDIDLSAKFDKSIEQLATQGRHYNITTILSAQVATNAISPAIRNNTSYLFIRKLNSETLKKQIYSMIISGEFENAEQFKEFINEHNKDYQFIMYDNNADEKGVQIVKATKIPADFKYVCREGKKEKGTKRVHWTAEKELF